MEKITSEAISKALTVPEAARAILIINNITYQQACNILLVIKDLRKEIENVFKPMKRKMDEAKKEILEQERKADIPLQEAEAFLKPQISKYLAEQERIKREEEERLREIAHKREEEERLREALILETEGNKKEADELLAEPLYVAPIILTDFTPKVAGISMQKRWTFRIVDVTKIPPQYLIPNEIAIGQVARALKDKANIPGIEIYSEDIVMAGRRQI